MNKLTNTFSRSMLPWLDPIREYLCDDRAEQPSRNAGSPPRVSISSKPPYRYPSGSLCRGLYSLIQAAKRVSVFGVLVW
jgi:hypothetical protein